MALVTGYYFYSQDDRIVNPSIKSGPVDKVVAMRIEKIDSGITFAKESLEDMIKQVNSDTGINDELQQDINSDYSDINDLLESWQSKLGEYRDYGEDVGELVEDVEDNAFLIKKYLDQIKNSVSNSNSTNTNYNNQISGVIEVVDNSTPDTVSLDTTDTSIETENTENNHDTYLLASTTTDIIDDGRPKLIEGTNKIE